MRQSRAVTQRPRFYVAKDGESLCGHQHETRKAAINCGGNAYQVIHSKTDRDGYRSVSYKKVSS